MKRHEIMSRVKNKNTKPELIVRSLLHQLGFRFRLHRKDLPGTPDITLSRYNTVVFVNGCLWHGHNCARGKLPKTNSKFWSEKINKNIQRDKTHIETLRNYGWNVIIVWDCETNSNDKISQLTEKFEKIRF